MARRVAPVAFKNGDSYALSGIGVTGWGESVYNVSVGGTDFEDVYNYFESGGLPRARTGTLPTELLTARPSVTSRRFLGTIPAPAI